MLRHVERGRLGQGTFHLAKVKTVVDGRYIHQGGGGQAHSPSPRLQAWGSQGGPYWTSRAHMGSGYGGHVRGFILRDGGSPSRIETHGEVPRIKEIFDDSGSSIILSRTGFLIRLKSNKVEISQERTLTKALREGCHEIKKARVGVSSREKMNTNMILARATTKDKSEKQTVSNGCVGQGGRDGGFEEHPNIGDL